MSEENKAIVRREFEEIFTQGNLDAADEIYASNYVGHEATTPEGIHGLQAAKQFASVYRSAFPDLQVTIEDQSAAEGEKVVTRWTARGTHQGELMGLAPTGAQVRMTGITISRIAEGKVAEDWTNFDALGMMQQIGAIPQPSTALHEGGISPEEISGRTHSEHPPQGGVSPEEISGG